MPKTTTRRRLWASIATALAIIAGAIAPIGTPSAEAAGWGGYGNGQIPLSEMTTVDGHYFRTDAAQSMVSLRAAYQSALGRPLVINDGYRNLAGQWTAWNNYLNGGNLAAPPGTSNHGWGLAVDFGGEVYQGSWTAGHKWLQANAGAYGWVWAGKHFSQIEYWHWEYVGGGTPSASPKATNAPTSIIDSSNRISLYAIRTDGNLWGASQAAAGSGLSPWQKLAGDVGSLVGRPSVVQLQNETLAIYARTASGTIVGTNQTSVGGSFTPWTTIGSGGNGIISDPVTVQFDHGGIGIYVTTDAGTVAGVAQVSAGASFGSWTTIGTFSSPIIGRPALAHYSDDRVGLFARTSTTQIVSSVQPSAGAAFPSWQIVGSGGSGVSSDPSVLIENDRVTVFAGAGATVAAVTQDSASAPFAAWANLASGPSAIGAANPSVLNTSGSYSIYVPGADGNVWGSTVPTAPAPSGWSQIGSGASLVSAVSSVRTASGAICVYGASAAGAILGTCQAAPGGAFGSWAIM